MCFVVARIVRWYEKGRKAVLVDELRSIARCVFVWDLNAQCLPARATQTVAVEERQRAIAQMRAFEMIKLNVVGPDDNIGVVGMELCWSHCATREV